MSTPDQIRTLKGLIRQLGCTDDEYRDMLYSNFQVNSSKHLCDAHAQIFIDRLKSRISLLGKQKFEDLAGRPGQATPAQLRMLEAMWKDVSKVKTVKAREEALDALLKNRLNLSGGLAWLEKKNVQRVVKLLRAMKADRDKKAEEGTDEKAG